MSSTNTPLLDPYPFDRPGYRDPPATPRAHGRPVDSDGDEMVELVPISTSVTVSRHDSPLMYPSSSYFQYPTLNVRHDHIVDRYVGQPQNSRQGRPRLFTFGPANHDEGSSHILGSSPVRVALRNLGIGGEIKDVAKPQMWLKFDIIDTNGGSFGDAYSIENIFRDDKSVYCSRLKRHVNIVLTHKSHLTPIRAPPFCVEEVCIRIPNSGFTSPLKNGFIFVCSEPVGLSVFDSYNSVDTHSLLLPDDDRREPVALPMVPSCVRTVLYFQLDTNTATFSYHFQTPIKDARYIFLKFLGSFGSQENIDVEFIGFKGKEGLLSFPKGELR